MARHSWFGGKRRRKEYNFRRFSGFKSGLPILLVARLSHFGALVWREDTIHEESRPKWAATILNRIHKGFAIQNRTPNSGFRLNVFWPRLDRF
jgi:hypothetical protein